MRVAAYALRAGALAVAMGIGAATGGMGVASAATGTVKWYNAEKEFGFIAADDGGGDVFLHFSAINISNWGVGKSLPEGLRVEYDLERNPRGPVAGSVRLLGGSFDPRSNRFVDAAASAAAKQAAAAKPGVTSGAAAKPGAASGAAAKPGAAPGTAKAGDPRGKAR